MRRKKRERAKAKLRRHPHRIVRPLSPAQQAYNEIAADHQDQEYIQVLMQERGYLPSGHGGWREMTPREKEMWG